MTELNMFDYIISISIGSIAAEMATELEAFWQPLVAMILYALVSLLFSRLTQKSIRVRRWVFGKSIVLLQNGKLYRENLNKAHLDLSEFLMQCRTNGYFDLSKLKAVIFEPSGKLSFLPYDADRPATPSDLAIVPQAEELMVNVIMDGKLLSRNLSAIGKDENWLQNQLKVQGAPPIDQIFLAIAGQSGALNVYSKLEVAPKNDLFE